jgi:hypothetical protein
MEKKPEDAMNREAPPLSAKRKPYVRPVLVFLGDVKELTLATGGSRGDGGPFGQSSTIQAKKEISYLDASTIEAVARSALSLRLATWRYKDATVDAHRYLGIIIEDSPDAPAVDRSRQLVDLYSYASMAIAAAQVQAKMIEQLGAEVERLRNEIATLKR